MCISDFGTISIEGMQFIAFHGVLPEERHDGNLFLVDFKCRYDISRAMLSDELSDTLDYGQVHHIVAQEMSVPSKLLEHVAGRIARRIASEHPGIPWFAVTVSKQNPPVEGRAEWSRVTVEGGASAGLSPSAACFMGEAASGDSPSSLMLPSSTAQTGGPAEAVGPNAAGEGTER